MNRIQDLLIQIELHSVEGIKSCFAGGINPNDRHREEPLLYELTSEYTRSPRFKDCVKAFVEAGLKEQDELLLAVLLDDVTALQTLLKKQPTLVSKKYTLRCAYTPLNEASLLHICAEFNHVACAEVLVNYGADINAAAGLNEYGFGGQTPVFHTVNQNGHQSAAMLDFLLGNNADLTITVKGFIWGKGYEWETLIPAVNPISYAMMGLLPQVHRDEKTISQVVTRLLKQAYGIEYIPANVPCAYLKP
jgi:hypothetical protein